MILKTKKYNFTNRILNYYTSDQWCKNTTDSCRGVCETHKCAGKVRAKIHMIDIMATTSSNIAGYSDYEDAYGQFRLILSCIAQTNQRYRRNPMSDRIANLSGCLSRYDISPNT
jgi:hypothetical protein